MARPRGLQHPGTDFLSARFLPAAEAAARGSHLARPWDPRGAPRNLPPEAAVGAATTYPARSPRPCSPAVGADGPRHPKRQGRAPGTPGGGKPALPHRGTWLSPPLTRAVTPYLRMCMVISTLIAGLLAALGPAALYRGVLVPLSPSPAQAAAVTATALLLAGAAGRRRSTAVALVPALGRGRRR